MWSSWIKRKGTTQVMYITKLKDGAKRVKKISQWFWKGFLKWYDGGGKIESHQKGFLKLKCFSSKYWLPLLFEETLGAFFSFSFFFLSFFFYAPSLEDLGGFDDI
jgi:hypothetical protein